MITLALPRKEFSAMKSTSKLEQKEAPINEKFEAGARLIPIGAAIPISPPLVNALKGVKEIASRSLEVALILQQLHYWIVTKPACVRDGKTWIFNTYDKWQSENFPFWSGPTIRRLFAIAEKANLIHSQQFDLKKGQARKYYSLNYDHEVLRKLRTPPAQVDQVFKEEINENTKLKTKEKNRSADRASGATTPTLTLVASTPSLSDQVNEIFDYWKTILRHPNAKLTNERKRLIETRLKRDGYTVEQIKQAIDGCSRSVFHQGGNSQGMVYDDLSLICRDGTHLERFIAFTEGTVRAGETFVGASKPAEPQTNSTPPSETEPDSTIWPKISEEIEEKIEEKQFSTWFRPLRGVGYDGQTLLIWAPDRVFGDWIRNNYRDVLEESLPESIADVRFVTTAETAAKQQQIEEVAA
ncbi:MAG: hypothetical protein JST85_22920 [Acidobacteria bacterium]|nr:hypothetical protein [Acidobacteriota bacterium]